MDIDKTSDKSPAVERHYSPWSGIAANLYSCDSTPDQFRLTPSDKELSCLPSLQLTENDPAKPTAMKVGLAATPDGANMTAVGREASVTAVAREGEAKPVGDQQSNENQLNGPDHATKNLIGPEFKLEGDKKTNDQLPLKLSTSKDADGDSKITIDVKDRIHGEQAVFTQPIDYQFHPVTPLQKKFQEDHPNVDLGHLVHVQFKAKSTGDNNMTVQIMGSEPPYKQSMTQRINLNEPDKAKDKDGYTSYDFYEVVPSTKDGKPLNFKLSLGREQEPGQIEIKGLNLQEVDSAPGLDPATAIKQYEQPGPASGRDARAPGSRENTDSSFMFGAIGNKLVDQNVRPTEHDLDKLVQQAQKEYPDDRAKQMEAVQEGIAQYKKDNTPTEQEKERLLQQLKEMGLNTLTIPVYWNQIEGQEGKADYTQVDHVVELAQKYGMKVKLHPVVWADCYPDWVDKGYAQAKEKDPHLSQDQYTKDVTEDHAKQVIDHFGKKFGNEIAYVEINEMNSTDVMQQAKTDEFGRVIRDANGQQVRDKVDNGLTKWIADDGPAAVINQVNAWIKHDLCANGMENTKLLENEYLVDQKTQSNDLKVSQDANHPDAFGFEAHQFASDYTDRRQNGAPLPESMNESDSLLSMYQQFRKREHPDMKNYLSELTVETTAAPDFDETKMSPEVTKAVQEEEAYRAQHHLDPLGSDQRKAQEKQAEELLAWYKMATSSESANGISLWDASEKNAWLGNTGGVINAEGDPKISYFVLKNFIHDFETPNPPNDE